ncbi:MAG: phenylalanine--tRNA ligase subunit beta [Rhodospirillales bacterium]|nr:phenylalanine--tRNA ligase subunit beta [Rhodospirillales bacterium]
MKFTLNWLREHLETDATLNEITERLTMIGLELEGVEDRAAALEGFVVAEVLEAEPHPDADKLRVCKVSTGKETFGVVCGAPNARAGMKGVFAAEGMYIPGIDVTLKKASIRGVESCGMLLSEREMGLSDEHSGIVDLAADAPVGAPAAEVMGLADPVIDIAITPNRGDCLGVRGVARDLAASGMGTLKPLDAAPVKGTFKSPIAVHLDFTGDDARACPYFVGRAFRGVKNGPSPKWLADRLLAIGLRPISALVDITNYLTFGLGRPAHVFDMAKVNGDIHVRFARPGEKVLALNGKEYELDDAMTVIADEKVAEAIAGIVGGEESGCTETTTDVFLEIAYFDPIRTAETGRRLNVQTDARYRFERGVDPAFLIDGAEVATRLILDLCGGEASELVVAGSEPEWRRELTMRGDRVKTLTGVDVPEAEQVRILEVVGCEVKKTGADFTVVPPSWRGDITDGIEGEAGLVEEIVRLWGYDKIPVVSTEREHALPKPALDTVKRRRSLARRTLAGRGMVEAVTYSFLPGAQAEMFGGGQESLRLVNPISADLDVMRPSLVPNLIAAAGRNADRGIADLALFEVGPQFAGDRPEDQAMVAAGVRTGRAGPRHWTQPPRAVDVMDAKADALAALAAIGAPVDSVQIEADAPGWYHPGRSGAIKLGPKNVLAWFGEVHPGVLKSMDVKGPIAAFEVFVDNLPKPKAKKGAARPHLVLSPYQAVERDFAFVVDAEIAADGVVRAAKGADKTLIAGVSVFDVFSGESLGAGKKSVAISVTLQPTEKTLTDEEIEAVAAKVVAAVAKHTGGALRG